MAKPKYGDLGFLGPRESYYGNTGDATRIEARKKAAFLTDMASFHKELSFKKKQHQEGMALEYEKLEKLGLGELEEREFASGLEYDIERRKLAGKEREDEQTMAFLKSYFEEEEEETGKEIDETSLFEREFEREFEGEREGEFEREFEEEEGEEKEKIDYKTFLKGVEGFEEEILPGEFGEELDQEEWLRRGELFWGGTNYGSG